MDDEESQLRVEIGSGSRRDLLLISVNLGNPEPRCEKSEMHSCALFFHLHLYQLSNIHQTTLQFHLQKKTLTTLNLMTKVEIRFTRISKEHVLSSTCPPHSSEKPCYPRHLQHTRKSLRALSVVPIPFYVRQMITNPLITYSGVRSPPISHRKIQNKQTSLSLFTSRKVNYNISQSENETCSWDGATLTTDRRSHIPPALFFDFNSLARKMPENFRWTNLRTPSRVEPKDVDQVCHRRSCCY